MLIALAWILTIVLYLPVFIQLYSQRWAEIDYTHAYFILPVSVLIIWLKRKHLRHLPIGNPNPKHCLTEKIVPGDNLNDFPRSIGNFYTFLYCEKFAGLFLIITGCLLFTFGWLWDYLFIETIALIPILMGLTLYLYSARHARILLFPYLYLLLLAPLPLGVLDSITLPMRHAVSIWAEHILRALQFPVSRQGLLIHMENHEIFMGAPCSGFRSMITMFSLGLIYIYFNKGRLLKNVILIISIIPLALLGNLIRVITLCLITFFFGKEAGEGFFHNFSGMVIFLIMITGLMGLELLLDTCLPQKKERHPINGDRHGEEKKVTGTEASAPCLSPIISSRPRRFRACLAAMILMITLSVCFGLPKPKYKGTDILGSVHIPTSLPLWRSIDMSGHLNLQQDDRYSFISGAFARVYGNPQGEKLLFLVLDARNFHHPKICFGRSGFQMKDLPDTEFNLPGRTLKAKTLFSKRGAESFVVIYWIVIDKVQADWNQQKFKQFWFSLWNKQKIGLMMRLDIPTDEEHLETSIQTAQQFISDIAENLHKEKLDLLFPKN